MLKAPDGKAVPRSSSDAQWCVHVPTQQRRAP